jgi:molybdopterin synthase sulfur carrier subunit
VTVTFHLAGFLRSFAGGAREVRVEAPGPTVGDALRALGQCHPGVLARILDEQGAVRRHVNVFLGERSIRDVAGLETHVADGDDISVLAAVSGGLTV